MIQNLCPPMTSDPLLVPSLPAGLMRSTLPILTTVLLSLATAALAQEKIAPHDTDPWDSAA
jgi:hypothetical protein